MNIAFKQRRASGRALLGASAVAGGTVVVDRIAKALTVALLDRGDAWPGAEWPLRIVHVINTGAAFGSLRGQTALLIVVSLLGVLGFAYFLVWRPGRTIHMAGLSLCLGGAAANLLDRLRSGEVVDSLKVEYWPAFNVADVAITVGIGVLLWEQFVGEGRRPIPKRAATDAEAPRQD